MSESTKFEMATFGGGCFWCTEAVFKQVKGVVDVTSGYAGGRKDKPTYEEVTTGRTGHAEVVQVTFDPNQISFRELVEILFATHDPTTLNRQGHDVGTQYRSLILYHDQSQKTIVEATIEDLEREKTFTSPIVTQVEPFQEFYEAEDYHKDYYARNTEQPYCRIVISPKLAKLRIKYLNKLKK